MAETDIESKIRALLAKATDPGTTEEERRTSASMAAKLAKEHGFVLQPAAKVAPPPPPAKVVDPWEVFMERLRKDEAAREAAKSPEQRAFDAGGTSTCQVPERHGDRRVQARAGVGK